MKSPGATPTPDDVPLHPQPAADPLEMIWLVIAMVIPLWVNLWAAQPFELSKILLFRSLVWLLAAGWLARRLVGRLVGRASRRRHLRQLGLLAPVGLLAVATVTSTLFAVNPRLSLMGSVERGQGALTLLSYPLLFLVTTSQMCDRAEARRLLTALVTTAGLIVPLSLLQSAGWAPFGLVSDARSPIIGTLGRANFVGAYLAMLVPLTLALTLTAKRRWPRRALGLLLAGELTVIALTLSRGAWLATGVGLATCGILWLVPRLSPRHRRRLIIACLLVCSVGLALGGALVARAQAGSFAARRTIWRAVVDLIRRRPLTGYGPDALGLVFPRVFPPQLVYYHGRGHFVDRAHSLLLDWTVTLGLPGAAAFLWMIAAIIALALRRLSSLSGRDHSVPWGERDIITATCTAAIVGHLAGTMVSFDVIATASTTWLLMALIASPALAPPPDEPTDRQSRPLLSATHPLRRIAAGLLVVGSVVMIAQFNGRPLLANVAHRTAVRRAENGDNPGALYAAQRAVQFWPWEPQHHALLGQITWLEARSMDNDPTLWARAEAALTTARDLQPEDYTAWMRLGDFYAAYAYGTQVDAATFAAAHQAYAQAASMAPHNARLYVAWGQVFLDEGRYGEALARFERAVDLDATDGLAFRLIGDMRLVQGQPSAALDAYREAVHWSPDAALGHLGLARSYVALGQIEAAQTALARAAARAPHHPAVLTLQQQLDATP